MVKSEERPPADQELVDEFLRAANDFPGGPRELAASAGVSYTTVSRILRGEWKRLTHETRRDFRRWVEARKGVASPAARRARALVEAMSDDTKFEGFFEEAVPWEDRWLWAYREVLKSDEGIDVIHALDELRDDFLRDIGRPERTP